MANDFGLSRRVAILAMVLLTMIWSLRLAVQESFVHSAKCLFGQASSSATSTCNRLPNDAPSRGGTGIVDKVAVITDTSYTRRLLPLIFHFHAVLGPSWPIVFYTSQALVDEHLQSTSSVWARAVNESRIDVRVIPPRFNLTSRTSVSAYLGQSWLWEQLAPAQHVLVFQADAMLCANARHSVDSFLKWDIAGAWLAQHEYNGGLSLRNRTMMLDVIYTDGTWHEGVEAGTWDESLGEDVWFSRKLQALGARLPPIEESLEFAVEFDWQADKSGQPVGYHTVHKRAPTHLDAIAEWCPEIMLASVG